MGSIYSGDPWVDTYHLIFILCYHSTKIHTLTFPTFGLTCSCRDFLDLRNYMDPHGRVVSYIITIPLSSSQNCSFSRILFGYCARCGGMLMVGSLPSISVVSPQWPPSGASLGSVNGCLQVLLRSCSTTICGQIDHMYIYWDTEIMHTILWGSESCYCNKDEYNRQNALCLWNPKNPCCENTAPSLLQSCTEVSAALEVFHRSALKVSAAPKCGSPTNQIS